MPVVDNKFLLDGQTLTAQQLNIIIQNDMKIDLTQLAWSKVKKSRETIYNLMSDNKKVVYGINTGFGNFADKIISFQERTRLQNNLIRSHAVCVGKPLPQKTVKRMTILRINTIAKGRSGLQPENLRKYIEAYNSDYIPMIPQKGTVGASGDLAPLSHLALGMMGQGFAWSSIQQKYVLSKEIMKQKKLQPLILKQKQGLALINGTQFMSAILSQIQILCNKLLDSAYIIYAFSLQIFALQPQLISHQLISFYQNTQSSIGESLRKVKFYLNDQISQLHKYRMQNNKNNQQPSSILLGFQNFSAVLQSLKFCSKILNEQINSATDNPLVYAKGQGVDQDKLVSGGNFHGQYVAKSADFISMALYSMARFSEARIQRYVNDRISDLPGFLAKNGGLNSCYMILQYTSAALLSQSKCLVKPASVDSISTSASQEDHVSMGGFAARKSRQLLQNVSYILGIQFMCVLQAVSIINKKPSQILNKIYNQARKYISYVQVDSYFGPQIQISKQLIQKGLSSLIQK